MDRLPPPIAPEAPLLVALGQTHLVLLEEERELVSFEQDEGRIPSYVLDGYRLKRKVA